MIRDISPSCLGPALDRILALRPEQGSLLATLNHSGPNPESTTDVICGEPHALIVN